ALTEGVVKAMFVTRLETVLAVVLVVGLCLAAVPAALLLAAAPPAGPSSTEVARLIGRLGDDDFAVREAATKRLMRAGEPALPALLEALASDDTEVRHRARRIVAAIEARLYPEL